MDKRICIFLCASLLAILLHGATAESPVIKVVNRPELTDALIGKSYVLLLFYDSKCAGCVKFLEEVKKLEYNYKDYVGFKYMDIEDPANNKTGEGYGIKQEWVSVALKDTFGGIPNSSVNVLSHPYPVLMGFKDAGSELFRVSSYATDSTLAAKMDAAGIRRPQADPFEKIKISQPPYISGKGKVMFYSLPTGKMDIKVFCGTKEIRKVVVAGGLVFWDLKDSEGNFVPTESYDINIDDQKGHKKTFRIKVEENK